MGAPGGDIDWNYGRTSEHSFSASSLSEPFPLISAQQYASLECVVNSLPPGASSWAAFEDVFDSLNVDQDELYPLCLKLTFERGLDWKDKWNNAKASLQERGARFDQVEGPAEGHAGSRHARRRSVGGLDVLKARLDQVTEIGIPIRQASPPLNRTPRVHRPERPRSTPPGSLAHGRARPAASAQPRREFLVSGGQGYSSSDDYVGVPSRRHSRVPASDYPNPMIDSPQIRMAAQTPVRSSALDIRADTFRRLSLLSMTYYNWRTRVARQHEREAQIVVARAAVLQRWTLQRWRTQLNRVTDLARTAATFRQQATEPLTRARAFQRWKKRVEGRRRAEWEAGLREAWEVVRTGWKEKTRRACLTRWRSQTLEARARRFARERIASQTLVRWRLRLDRVLRIQHWADEQELARNRALARWALGRWLTHVELEQRCRGWMQTRMEVTLSTYWAQWRRRTLGEQEQRRLQGIAITYSADVMKRVTLQKWQAKLHQVEAMSSTCDNFIARRSRDLIQRSLNLWIMSWSARLMHHTRTLRLLRHAIATWTEKYYKVSIDLDARGAALLEHWAMRTKQECWNQWTAAISCRVEMNNQAEMFVSENTRLRYWTRWQMVLRRKAIDANKARVARDFFLQRRAWSAWHERLQARNTKRWIAKQVNRRKREILLFWLAKAKQSKSDGVLVAEFSNRIDRRIMSEMFSLWIRRAVGIRARETKAASEYEFRLKQASFDHWTRLCIAHDEAYALADSSLAVNADETRARLFRQWLAETRRRVELQKRLVSFRIASDRRVAIETFGIWREEYLRPIEGQVIALRDAREKSAAFSTWKQASKYLPFTHNKRHKLLKRSFEFWRSQVPNSDLKTAANRWYYESSVGPRFEIWRIKAQARIALRSVHRVRTFGLATSPNSSLGLGVSYRTAATSPPAASPRSTAFVSQDLTPVRSQTSPPDHLLLGSSSPNPLSPSLSTPSPTSRAVYGPRTSTPPPSSTRLTRTRSEQSLDETMRSEASAGGAASETRTSSSGEHRDRTSAMRARLKTAARAGLMRQ